MFLGSRSRALTGLPSLVPDGYHIGAAPTFVKEKLRRAPGRNLTLMEAAEKRMAARLTTFFAATARHTARKIGERLNDAGKMGKAPDAAAHGRELSSPLRRASQRAGAGYLPGTRRAMADLLSAADATTLGGGVGDAAARVDSATDARSDAAARVDSAVDARSTRDAFLYLDPTGDSILDARFAQCGTCKEFLADDTCFVFGSKVVAEASCGLYIPGAADPDWTSDGTQYVSPTAAGYVVRDVRCENCYYFDATHSLCGLFVDLNRARPDVWNLNPFVHRQGCCNAQTPMIVDKLGDDVDKSSDHPGGADLHVQPENAEPIHGLKLADAVTSENVQHVSWEMVRENKTRTQRMRLPLDILIATQRVVDRQRVLKHMQALLAGESLEPDQKPPLIIYWNNDYFILGGHHGLQAAYDLGIKEVDLDGMAAPD